DGGARPVREPRDLTVIIEGDAPAHVEYVVAGCPLERGLQLEALTLALLVICGDALGGLGRDVLDAVDVVDDLRVAERGAARVTHRGFVSPVARATRLADAHG